MRTTDKIERAGTDKGVRTEVQHGGRVTAGSVVGHQVDLSLPLLLLHSLFSLPVPISAAAAEQD